jgi:hypothetical protein
LSDLDWSNSDIGYVVDQPALISPPRWGVLATFIAALVALGLAAIDPRFGYLMAVIAASVGGFTAASDQKRRADSNYASYNWFMPALRISRYLALFVGAFNIAILAIEIARGGSLI